MKVPGSDKIMARWRPAARRKSGAEGGAVSQNAAPTGDAVESKAARVDVVESAAPAAKQPKAARRIVVLIPGLYIPAWVIFPLMSWSLRRAGWRPVWFRYPTLRCDIPENARLLALFLRSLGREEVDVVTFSLGGIVLRWAANHHELPRIGRAVLLAPPNHGAFMADRLHEKLGWLFPLFWGRAALQLRRGDKGLAARAGDLPKATEVGIIAGGTGKGKGFNPAIPGDNDLTVAVAETILPGMTDFALVRSVHSGLPVLGRSRGLVVRFLKTGHFRGKAEG